MIQLQKQNLSERMEDILLLLSQEKQLQALESQSLEDIGFAHYINVKDNQNFKYSLLVYDSNNQEVLLKAQQHSNILKTLNHPNIAKYYNDFQLGGYYFVQIEAIPCTLLNWIDRNQRQQQLDQISYLDIVLQMMEATHYLVQNKCNLYLQQTLSCFMIDGENKTKLFFFNPCPEKVNPLVVQQILKTCIENEELFYYPEYLLKIKSSNPIYHDHLFDVWALGICFYHLVGVSCDHILKYIKGLESYTYQDSISFEINCILYVLIFHFSNWYQRPSLSLLKEQLSIQMKQISAKQDQIENREEIVDQQQLLDDFAVFQKCYTCFYKDNGTGSEQLLESFEPIAQRYKHFDLISFISAKIQSDNSRQNFVKTLELNPKYDSALVHLALLSTDDNEIKKLYLQALEVNPNYEYALYNLGNAYNIQKEYEEAIKYYRRTIEVSPHFGSTYCNLGNVYFYTQQTEEAIKCLIQDIQLHDESSYAHYLLESICSNKLNFKDAKNYLESLIEDDATNCIALHQLGRLYMNQKQMETALKYYKKVLSLNYQSIRFIEDFVSLYEKQYQYQNAICLLKLVSQTNNKAFKSMRDNYRYLFKYEKSLECAIIYSERCNANLSLYHLVPCKRAL